MTTSKLLGTLWLLITLSTLGQATNSTQIPITVQEIYNSYRDLVCENPSINDNIPIYVNFSNEYDVKKTSRPDQFDAGSEFIV